jgi:uncharacterized membrane protein YkvA (DUF1232 family)
MWSGWWTIPVSVVGGLVVLWLRLVVALWFAKPDDFGLREAVRLLPDVRRLLERLAGDSTAPRGIRRRVTLLLAYLGLPIDRIPDFIPVIGYADDAVIVALVLRSVARLAGTDKLSEHRPGTPQGLVGLCRLPNGRTPPG